MKPLITQFFKYLEDTEGQKTPFKVKLLNPKEFKLTPKDLYVKGDLNLENTKITSLPRDLKIEGNLEVGGSPLALKTEDEIREMAPGLKGRVKYGNKFGF